MSRTEGGRRSGAETRAEILRVATELFIQKGFEGTSIRDIASALGVTKSSLYYHFKNKDEIARSLTERRVSDADDLFEWIITQQRTPDLLQRAALRWIEATSEENVKAMRLAHANQPVVQRMSATGRNVRSGMERVVDYFLEGDESVTRRLMIRMVFNAPAAALLSSYGAPVELADIRTVARAEAIALTDLLQAENAR